MKGSATNMSGKVKEGAGKLTGDQKLQAEGKGDQYRGPGERIRDDVMGCLKDSIPEPDPFKSASLPGTARHLTAAR